jgi:microcystin-dependent protein
MRQTAVAQQDPVCSELLRHGLRDTVRVSQSNSEALSSTSSLCSAYHQYQTGQLSASVGVSIPGLKGLGVNGELTQQQVYDLGQSMCDNKTLKTDDQATINRIEDTINPDAAAAFVECVRLSSKGLHVVQQYNETSQSYLSVDVSWSGSSPITFTGQTVINPADSAEVKCEGPLTSVKNGDSLGAKSVGLHCQRQIGAQPTIVENQRKLFARELVVTVFTSEGNVVRRLAPLPPAPPPGVIPQVPVGTVIAFTGKSVPEGWLLCDGSKMLRKNAEVLFQAIHHMYDPPVAPNDFDDSVFYLPDYRGRFLRGLDIDKDGNSANRDVDRDAKKGLGFGSTEEDQVGYHVHQAWTAKTVYLNDNPGNQKYNALSGQEYAADKLGASNTLANVKGDGTPAGAGTETRPKNIAVSWIIRSEPETYLDASYVSSGGEKQTGWLVTHGYTLWLLLLSIIVAILLVGRLIPRKTN